MDLSLYKSDYLLSLKEKGRMEGTLKRYLFDLNDFFLWYSVQLELNSQFFISNENAQKYFSYLALDKQYSFASLKRIRTVLNQYFKFLQKRKIINENPFPSTKVEAQGLKIFSSNDFVLDSEMRQLFNTVSSTISLTEKQLEAHKYLKLRNHVILLLLYTHGLTLKEVTNLHFRSVDFYHDLLHIESETSLSRTIFISLDEKRTLYQYIDSIPKPVRPRPNSDDPFFVAFDFARKTYRWNYKEDKPKKLTEIAIQKMIRNELSRAEVRSEISAQHLRRTAILNALKSEESLEKINIRFGFKANNSLTRYITYLEMHFEREKTQAT